MLKVKFSDRPIQLKKVMQSLWGRIWGHDFDFARVGFSHVIARFQKRRNHEVSPQDVRIDNYHYESHRIDDMPLTLARSSGPGIKYGYTDNSPLARDAEKVDTIGIDSFGEDTVFRPERRADHQDFQKRDSNLDLDQGHFSHGS